MSQNPTNTSTSLSDSLGSEAVTIFVGPTRKKFTIHKKLLCNSSDFFAKAFQSGAFKEGQEGKMDLPEDEPSTFGIFVDWLYQGRIPAGNSESYLNSLYNLYIFAEKIVGSAELKDKTMDQIQEISRRYHQVPGHVINRKVAANTSPSSCLRKFCLNVLWWRARLYFGIKDEVSGANKDRVTRYINSDIQLLHEFLKEDLPAFQRMIWSLNDKREKEFFRGEDPRMVHKDIYEKPYCVYHCHDATVECQKVDKIPTWIQDITGPSVGNEGDGEGDRREESNGNEGDEMEVHI